MYKAHTGCLALLLFFFFVSFLWALTSGFALVRDPRPNSPISFLPENYIKYALLSHKIYFKDSKVGEMKEKIAYKI